jgi:hypothetical protein
VLDDIQPPRTRLLLEMKTLCNTLERSFGYARLRLLDIALSPAMSMATAGWRQFKMRSSHTGRWSQPTNGSLEDIVRDSIQRPLPLVSRAVMHAASRARIVARRRANYARLLEATRDLPGCEVMFPRLPCDVVPHVFPLLIDEPERVFSPLKREGVPIIRFGEFLWPGMPRTRCAVSLDLSRRVFQFPCHQELLPNELEWMISHIRAAICPQRHNRPGQLKRRGERHDVEMDFSSGP